MKRFTDTAKWSDPWFRRLSAPAKMLWFYILDHCDNVGIIEIDLELASMDCGIKITNKTLEEIGERVETGIAGKHIVPKFVGFQIGKPSDSCAAHKKVIKAIEDNNLELDSLGYHYPKARLLDDYAKGINTLKDKEEDKEEDKDKKVISDKPSKAKPGSQDELNAYFAEVGLTQSDADYAWNHWESKGWKNGRDTIKDWKAAVRSWKAAGYWPSQKDGFTPKAAPKPKPKPNLPDGWQEIASDYFERSIECDFDDLSGDDQFALQNHIRYMEEAS
jgi:hypothetical protein